MAPFRPVGQRVNEGRKSGHTLWRAANCMRSTWAADVTHADGYSLLYKTKKQAKPAQRRYIIAIPARNTLLLFVRILDYSSSYKLLYVIDISTLSYCRVIVNS